MGKAELEGVVFPSRGKKSNFAAFAPEGVREAALKVQFTPPFGTGILTERTEVKHGPRVRQNSFNNCRFAVRVGYQRSLSLQRLTKGLLSMSRTQVGEGRAAK